MNGGLASAAAFDADDPDELPVLEPDPVLPLVEPDELEDPLLELVDDPDELDDPVLELVDDPLEVLLLVVVLERVLVEPDDELVLLLVVVVLLLSELPSLVMVTSTDLTESS